MVKGLNFIATINMLYLTVGNGPHDMFCSGSEISASPKIRMRIKQAFTRPFIYSFTSHRR